MKHLVTLPNAPTYRAYLDLEKDHKTLVRIARANGVRYYRGRASKTTEHLLPVVTPVS